MKITNNLYFFTKCKKDYKYFKKDKNYVCAIVDNTSCCVCYDGPHNLLFLNSEFIEIFYTEFGIRKLKLEKIVK